MCRTSLRCGAPLPAPPYPVMPPTTTSLPVPRPTSLPTFSGAAHTLPTFSVGAASLLHYAAPSRGAGLPPSCATPLSSSRRRASPLPHRRAAPLPRGATSLLAASLPPRAAAPVTPPPPTDPVDPRDHRRDGAPPTPPSRRILAPSNRAEPGTHGSSRASCLRPSSLLDPGRILLRRRAPSPAAPPHPDPVNLQPVPTITRSLELAGGSSPGPSSSRQRARSRGEDIPCFPASSTNHGNVCGG
ncbi:vegetative cell wall protein gp1 [Triticum aestivum]|uniref:vegetative cell wall protein gp1 n=1 Tax=Triticum aestivum TaxID=4565 RepID=UPI001D021C37|nr:vegetative cell wall protein gp1-like [Triticum aestivum]